MELLFPRPPAPEPLKFGLLADLGIITVPADYVHSTQLASFKAKHQGGRKKSFAYFNDEATDGNYMNPSRILMPGDKLWVRAHKQVVSGTTTSDERMAFLATLNSHHVGAQGASLVFDQKREQLPKGYWYASMDVKEYLWKDAVGYHRVPVVSADSNGDFHFHLGSFGHPWYGSDAVLSFCDVPLET